MRIPEGVGGFHAAALRALGDAHDASSAQVALAGLVTQCGDSVFAIPGASWPEQAAEDAAAIDLRLTQAEMTNIDGISTAIARRWPRKPISPWPRDRLIGRGARSLGAACSSAPGAQPNVARLREAGGTMTSRMDVAQRIELWTESFANAADAAILRTMGATVSAEWCDAAIGHTDG